MSDPSIPTDVTRMAMKETFERIATLPPDQIIPYMTQMLQVTFELLRAGGDQDEFVRGLLDGAHQSLKQPCFLTMKDLRVN